MEKIKEKVIEINKTKNGGWESQSTYYANVCVLNEVIIRGNLEINILALIRNLEDDDETSIFLEIYNLDIYNNYEENFIQFNFDYRDIEDYSFDNELLKSVSQTLNNVNAYRL